MFKQELDASEERCDIENEERRRKRISQSKTILRPCSRQDNNWKTPSLQHASACHAEYVYKSLRSSSISVEEIDGMVSFLAICIMLSIGLIIAILLLILLRKICNTSMRRHELINIEVNQDDFIAERRELINVEVNRDDFIAEFGEEFDFASSNSVDSGIFGCDQ